MAIDSVFTMVVLCENFLWHKTTLLIRFLYLFDQCRCKPNGKCLSYFRELDDGMLNNPYRILHPYRKLFGTCLLLSLPTLRLQEDNVTLNLFDMDE